LGALKQLNPDLMPERRGMALAIHCHRNPDKFFRRGGVMQSSIVQLLLANLLLQILDGVASYHILSAGVPEVNPLVSYYIDNWGLMGGLCYGKLVGCALVWLIFLLRKRVGPMVVKGLILIACFYSILGILLMAKMVSLYV
jgi:hypothetical protein